MHPIGGNSDHRSTSGNLVKHQVRENPYGHHVLMGNWFEERFADKTDKKAITPAINGQSQCMQEKPLYKSDFTQPIAHDSQRDFEEYKEWKMQGFSNRLNGEISNIKLWDGHQYEKNITTTTDLMYRILPAKIAKRHSPGEGKFSSNEDYSQSYGNCTKTGLLQWRLCEAWREFHEPCDVSHYKNTFKRIPLPRKEPVCKQSMKKTSLI